MNVALNTSARTGAALQSHGAVLAFENGTEHFLWGSENAHHWVGLPQFDNLIGQTALQVFDRRLTHAIRNANSHDPDTERRLRLGIFRLAETDVQAWMFTNGNHFIIELVSPPTDPDPDPTTTLNDVALLNAQLLLPDDTTALQECARVLRTLSGFKSVAVMAGQGIDANVITCSGDPFATPVPWSVGRHIHEIPDLTAPVLTLRGADVPRSALNASGMIAPGPAQAQALAAYCTACATMGFGNPSAKPMYFAFLHHMPRALNSRTRFALDHLGLLLRHRFA
jgi:hypothetical protein